LINRALKHEQKASALAGGPTLCLLLLTAYTAAPQLTQNWKCQDPATVHVWSRLEPGRAEPAQDYCDFQPQLNGRRIAKVGVQRSCGKDLRGEQNRRRVGEVAGRATL
jgi:hypothetical protein